MEELPPSPFRTRPLILGDNLRFGIMLCGDQPRGAFVKASSVIAKAAAIAPVLPHPTMTSVLLPLLAPPPLISLAKEYRHEWRSYKSLSEVSSEDARMYPWNVLSGSAPVEHPFVFVSIRPGRWAESPEMDDIFSAWTGVLAANGMPCDPWVGETLKWIHNGHHQEDIFAKAWHEADVFAQRDAIASSVVSPSAQNRRKTM